MIDICISIKNINILFFISIFKNRKKVGQNDLWFHIKNNPSPHGIIHSDTKEEPTKDVIYKTAELVKSYSKYKDLSKITIIYTKLKNIKRTDVLGSVIIKNKTKEVVI